MYQLLGAGLIAGGLVLATPALAAGYCSAGMATESIAAGNVSFEGASADDCYGVGAGNINGNTGAAILNDMTWGTGWTYLDATDDSSASFMGIEFSVTATPGSSGSFTLTGKDINGPAPLNLPSAFDFVVGLKGGNEYAMWGFDDVVIDGSDSGTFSIVFTNRGGNTPALSHMIVFGRESGGGTIASIPEANTYAMLLAGLGLVGFVTRRKLG